MVDNRIVQKCHDLDYHAGDIIWIDFEPHSGTEEGGHNPKRQNVTRPMLVCLLA